MKTFTIYWSPDDEPDKYVLREFRNNRPLPTKAIGPDINVFRAAMANRGLSCFPRMPDDAPCVVETWL